MKWRTCPTCWGQGRLLRLRQGRVQRALVCPTCIGVGEIAHDVPEAEAA